MFVYITLPKRRKNHKEDSAPQGPQHSTPTFSLSLSLITHTHTQRALNSELYWLVWIAWAMSKRDLQIITCKGMPDYSFRKIKLDSFPIHIYGLVKTSDIGRCSTQRFSHLANKGNHPSCPQPYSYYKFLFMFVVDFTYIIDS